MLKAGVHCTSVLITQQAVPLTAGAQGTGNHACKDWGTEITRTASMGTCCDVWQYLREIGFVKEACMEYGQH